MGYTEVVIDVVFVMELFIESFAYLGLGWIGWDGIWMMDRKGEGQSGQEAGVG